MLHHDRQTKFVTTFLNNSFSMKQHLKLHFGYELIRNITNDNKFSQTFIFHSRSNQGQTTKSTECITEIGTNEIKRHFSCPGCSDIWDFSTHMWIRLSFLPNFPTSLHHDDTSGCDFHSRCTSCFPNRVRECHRETWVRQSVHART